MKKSKKTLLISANLNRSSLFLISILFLAAFLRLYFLAQQPLVCDEGLIIAPNKIYFQEGILPFRNWHHPPFRYFFLYLSAKIFGEHSFSFRLPSVLFAIGSVFLCYLLGKHFFGKKVGLLAALFLATDPLHLAFSRLAFEESQLTFFILLSLFLTFKYQEKKDPFLLFVLGLTLGLGIGTKWLFLPVYGFVFAYLNYFAFKEKRVWAIITLFNCLILLPFSIYMFSFLPWFERGYTFFDWIHFQFKMAESITSVKITEYGDLIGVSSSSWLWFFRPLFFAYQFQLQNNLLKSVAGFINPFLWFIFFPCVVFLFASPEGKKIKPLVIAFLAFIIPILLSRRPIYLYSATPVTAFISIVIASAISILANKSLKFASFLRLYVAIAILYSLWLFPLETGLPVSYNFYQTILNFYGN